ncbi:MAG: hypothetical protein R3D71_05865 [Rickettsiales bacterium]
MVEVVLKKKKKKTVLTAEQKRAIKALYNEEGWSRYKIAKFLGVPETSVSVAATREETPPPYSDKGTIINKLSDLPPPQEVARIHLGSRLKEKNGGYVLDGVPTSFTGVMQATNRLLQRSDMEQIINNPSWRV